MSSPFTILLLCIQACLIQVVFGQCGCGGIVTNAIPAIGIGSRLGAGEIIGGLGYNGLGYNDLGAAGPSAAFGEGEVAVGGELSVGGITNVAGQIPVVGFVTFEGVVPAFGAVTIDGNCGYPCGCGC